MSSRRCSVLRCLTQSRDLIKGIQAIRVPRQCRTLSVHLALPPLSLMHELASFVSFMVGVSLNALSVEKIFAARFCQSSRLSVLVFFGSGGMVLSFIAFVSCLVGVKIFTSIHHFFLDSLSAKCTVSSSDLTSWTIHCSTILLMAVLFEVRSSWSCCWPCLCCSQCRGFLTHAARSIIVGIPRISRMDTTKPFFPSLVGAATTNHR